MGEPADTASLQRELVQAREAVQRLERIIEGMDAGTWEWNVRSGQMHVNARWAAIVGYRLEELAPISAETFAQLVHPDDIALSDRALQAHFAGETPAYECLVRMRHRDGHWVWVQDRGRVQARDADGQPLWVAGAHADVSDLQQVRQEVAGSRQRLQSILDASDEVAVIVVDTAGQVTLFNTGAERLLGWSASAVVGQLPLSAFIAGDEIDAFLQASPGPRSAELFPALARLAGEQTFSRQWTVLRRDGQRRQVRLSLSALRDAAGQLTGFVGMATDLTRILQARAEARLAEEKFAGAFTSAALGMALVSLEGRWLDVNEALCRILGYTRAELLQTDFQRLTHPDDLDTDLQMVDDLLHGRRAHYHLEKRYFDRHGRLIWGRLSVSLVRSEHGDPLHFVSQIQDITAQRSSELRLQEAEQRSRITLDAVTDLVLSVDLDGRVEHANAAALRAFSGGGGARALQGRPVNEVVQLTTEYAPSSVLDTGVLLDPDSNAVDLHADLLLVEGERRTPVDLTQAWLHDDEGHLRGAVWVIRDVTQQRARQREARQLAEIDPLTELVNRRGFEAHLQQAIAHLERTGQAATLMFIDLDRLKPVNDTWGHLAGDAVLWGTANALRQAVRDSDVVARLGGDEFAVILAGCSLRRAQRIGGELLEAVGGIRIAWEGQQIRIGASIGIAAIQPGMRVDDAVAAADSQCYRAKAAGRNTVRSEPLGQLPGDDVGATG